MSAVELTDEASVRDFIADASPGFLFKHSNACPVSFSAYDEVRAWADANPDARVGYVVIQVNRQLSNLIAGILQRVHQSPQLFLVADGAASFHASHWSITAGAMDKAWGEAAR